MSALTPEVRAILDQFPMSDDGTGHIVDCGYDDEQQKCGCYTLPGRLAVLVAAAKAEALRDLTHEWQFGGWAVLSKRPDPAAIPAIAYGQRVTDWLRERADRIGGAA